MENKTLVIGASDNPERYAFKAVEMLSSKGYEVIAVGPRQGRIGAVPILKELPSKTEPINTITLYLSAKNQQVIEDQIIALHPLRIIFNPGAENPSLKEKAEKANIQTIEACTLVMLSTGQY